MTSLLGKVVSITLMFGVLHTSMGRRYKFERHLVRSFKTKFVPHFANILQHIFEVVLIHIFLFKGIAFKNHLFQGSLYITADSSLEGLECLFCY